MLTLYTDVPTTRRQRLHHVMDETKAVRWSGKNIEGALEYLYETGQLIFWIEGQRSRWSVTIRPEPV